ncbi:hypothetical protein M2432_003438 [Mycobacterium sp. OTB74]|nr:hypothetical protein [Mycobacterium sp. OTB74]
MVPKVDPLYVIGRGVWYLCYPIAWACGSPGVDKLEAALLKASCAGGVTLRDCDQSSDVPPLGRR